MNPSDEENKRENPTAKKSTTKSSNCTTRRQTALQQLNTLNPGNSHKGAIRRTSGNFMDNFNPDTSMREKRKLHRKINPKGNNVRKPAGALYDENGVHISTSKDLCDCLNEDCEGCFFDCPKCGSQKCGTECRVHRKYIVEEIEYHGYDKVVKSPLMK